jgi:20S proteasome subunit alpha 3
MVTKNGIILSCEKESTSKLYEREKFSEKIYKIDRNIAVAVGGIAADANLLIDYARDYSQNYFYKYKNYTPIENVVRYISDTMQIKTQFGSTRPYGAGFLFGGWDRVYGYQLYNSEPSGIYNTWKAHAIGKNDQSAQSTLKQYYENNLDLEAGLKLTVKVLKKTLDKNKLNGENVEIFILQRNEEDGEIVQKNIDTNTINNYIKEIEEEEEKEKKEASKKKEY